MLFDFGRRTRDFGTLATSEVLKKTIWEDRVLPEMPPKIEVSHIVKSFGLHRVLDDVNLSVKPNETVAILGPSGSGKSTLLRCMNLLEWPDSGSVLLDGSRLGYVTDRKSKLVRATEKQLASQRSHLGMVFQHSNLWPHLTVLGNVTASPLYVQRRPRAEVEAEAMKLLERVGLLDKKDEYPIRLSGGQQQRLGIARALAIRPDVLLFDEPTSALDPELVGEVLMVIKSLAVEGRTMIIVTHELSFARDVADRIVFMDCGRIVEEAPPAAFFAAPSTDRARSFLERYG